MTLLSTFSSTSHKAQAALHLILQQDNRIIAVLHKDFVRQQIYSAIRKEKHTKLRE